MNRRRFFKQSMLAGAAAEFAPLGGAVGVSASDRLGVEIIGRGGMGRANQIDFQKCADAEVVAVCDVYRPHLDRALGMTGGKSTPYHHYRKLLDDSRVNAVVIAAPDHDHPLLCLNACLAGTDVAGIELHPGRTRDARDRPANRSCRAGRTATTVGHTRWNLTDIIGDHRCVLLVLP